MSALTSVVVVSYNNYDQTTGPCLKSLLADDVSPAFEIVVVDNASTDGTAERLRRAADAGRRVKMIFNHENRGFAGGNNDGVAAAQGAIVVLLNSDTRVPPGAIGDLGAAFARHSQWQMLGPVTNEAGNEQKIFTRGADPEAILDQGRQWCRHAGGAPLPSQRLDFFCVALERRLYQTLGGLDEDFGPGYFEDTDFSLRAMQAGVRMGLTEAVFVYHRGGQSFSRQGRAYVHRLMRDNRRRLCDKHPGAVTLRHQRDCNLAVMDIYADLAAGTPPAGRRGLAYRFDNRWQLARGWDPRGPLKRWGYRRRLARCVRRFDQALGRAD